jgi:hypothetical protein
VELSTDVMYVYKRGTFLFGHYVVSSPAEADQNIDGRKERVQFDKITARVSRLCYGLDPEHVDPAAITQKVISGVYQGVTTVELDNLVSGGHVVLL